MNNTLDITAVLIVLFFLLVGSVQAQERGWLLIPTDKVEADKQMHVAGHMGVSFVSYLIFEPMENVSELEAITYTFGVSNLIGFWKESTDATGFDWNDIKANNIGFIIGTFLSWQLRRWAKKSVNRMSEKEKAKLKLDKFYE